MSSRKNFTAATTALCLTFNLAFNLGSSFAAPPAALPALPASGVDPDLTHALETAHENLEANKPAQAAKDVLNLYLTNDRFTAAQRPMLASDGQALLRESGKQLIQSGQLESGLTALDGAWLASGRAPDPEYGKLLVDAAARTSTNSRAEALYLARRARQVDPSNPAAEQADKHYSANRYKTPALAMLIVGGVALAGGIIAYAYAPASPTDGMGMGTDTGKIVRIAGIGTAVLGGVVLAGGSLMLRFGKPVSEPVSPSYLPAYLDATN